MNLENITNLKDCIYACTYCLKQLESNQRTYLMLGVTVGITLCSLAGSQQYFVWGFMLFKFFLSGFMFFFIFMATIWNAMERNSVLGAKMSMEIRLQHCEAQKDM